MGRPKGPPTETRSIRLPVTEWERLEHDAKAAGTTLNPHVAKILAAGGVAAKPPTIRNTSQVKSEPLIDDAGKPVTLGGVALHVDVPVSGTFERKPMQKGQRRTR